MPRLVLCRRDAHPDGLWIGCAGCRADEAYWVQADFEVCTLEAAYQEQDWVWEVQLSTAFTDSAQQLPPVTKGDECSTGRIHMQYSAEDDDD